MTEENMREWELSKTPTTELQRELLRRKVIDVNPNTIDGEDELVNILKREGVLNPDKDYQSIDEAYKDATGGW